VETILIVDDDQVYLDLLKLNLESFGFRVVTGGSAGEAWTRLDRDRVDLVVLDANMPGEDGNALTRRLRADTRLSPIPIVFLSGYAGPGEQARAFESGADDFIAKPCGPNDLVTRVRSHLRRRAWQRRIDDGLARIQEVERSRDELLSIVVNEVGGLISTIDAELREALEPGRLAGEGVGDVARAREYARSLAQIVEDVRARFGWRQLAERPVATETAPPQ
jgi:DNA-binding response OmpR family regulator